MGAIGVASMGNREQNIEKARRIGYGEIVIVLLAPIKPVLAVKMAGSSVTKGVSWLGSGQGR